MPSSSARATSVRARLGVAHGGCVIAVDGAEIALPLDQRVALRELLRQPHQRLVHRGVAVGVILADHVTDDAGALLEPGGGVEAELLHGVQQPAMHRLQPVAHIGQRPGHDGGHRIGEVALAQRVGKPGVLDVPRQRISHLSCP